MVSMSGPVFFSGRMGRDFRDQVKSTRKRGAMVIIIPNHDEDLRRSWDICIRLWLLKRVFYPQKKQVSALFHRKFSCPKPPILILERVKPGNGSGSHPLICSLDDVINKEMVTEDALVTPAGTQ